MAANDTLTLGDGGKTPDIQTIGTNPQDSAAVPAPAPAPVSAAPAPASAAPVEPAPVDPSAALPAPDTSATGEPPRLNTEPAPQPAPEAGPATLPSETDWETNLDNAGTVAKLTNPWQSFYVKARMEGFSKEEIRNKMTAFEQKALQAGFTQDEISAKMGFNVNMTMLDAWAKVRTSQVLGMIAQDPKAQTADGFFPALINGLLSQSGLGSTIDATFGWPVAPEAPADNWQSRLGMGIGANASGMALAAAGTVAGGPGAGAVAYGADDFLRRVVADVHLNGGMSSNDILMRIAGSAWEAAKDSALLYGAIQTGNLAGGVAVAAGAGPALGAVANAAGFTAFSGAVQAGMNGGVVDWESLMDNAIIMAGIHAGGALVKVTPIAVAKARTIIIDTYRKTGLSPTAQIAALQAGTLPPGVTRPMVPPAPTPKVLREMATDLGDQLHAVSTMTEETNIDFAQRIDNLPAAYKAPPEAGGYRSVDAKIFNEGEAGRLNSLSPTEKQMYDQHVKPLKDEETTNRPLVLKYTSKGGIVDTSTADPNYWHRIGEGKGNAADEFSNLSSGAAAVPFEIRFRKAARLSTAISSEKAPVYYKASDMRGNHKILSDYPAGDAVYLHQDGARSADELYGATFKLVEGKWIPAYTKEGKTTVEKIKVPVVEANQITPGKIIPGGKVVAPKNVPGHDTSEHIEPTTKLQDGHYFIEGAKGTDVNPDATEGKVWKISRPTAKEITEAAGQRYYDSAMLSVMENLKRQRQVIAVGRIMDSLKANLEKTGLGVEGSNKNMEPPPPVEGERPWRSLDLPYIGRWWLHPEMADVLDDFKTGGPKIISGSFSWKNPLSYVIGLNKLGLQVMFLSGMGTLVHGKNILNAAFVGRGFDNFTKGLPGTSIEAWKDVHNLSPMYREALKAGAGLASSRIGANSLTKQIMDGVGLSIAQDEKFYGPLARKLGVPNATSLSDMYMKGMSKELFHLGDVMYMQRYRELRMKGLTPAQAVKETEMFTAPNYRAASMIGGGDGGRAFAKLMGDNNAIWFGRWTQFKFSALANMATSLGQSIKDPSKRYDAIGRFVAMGVVVGIVHPILTALYQTMTGNPYAKSREGGVTQIVSDVGDIMTHPGITQFLQVAHNTLNPAVGMEELFQQITGLDFFTGKTLAAPGANWRQFIAEHANHLVNNVAIPDNPLTVKYWEKAAGISDPNAYYERLKEGGMTPQMAAAVAKAAQKDPWLERWLLGF